MGSDRARKANPISSTTPRNVKTFDFRTIGPSEIFRQGRRFSNRFALGAGDLTVMTVKEGLHAMLLRGKDAAHLAKGAGPEKTPVIGGNRTPARKIRGSGRLRDPAFWPTRTRGHEFPGEQFQKSVMPHPAVP